MHKGFLFALLTMLCWGFAPVFAKIGLSKLDTLTALVFRNTFIAIMLLLVFFFSGQAKTIFTSNIKSIYLIIIEAALAGLIGQYFYYKAVKTWEVSKVVPIVGAYPLVSFLIAFLFLSERITICKTAGIALIVTGIALLGI